MDDCPVLLGLDFLDTYGLFPDNPKDQLVCPGQNWSIPKERKNGHVFVIFDEEAKVLYTKVELIKIHRGFGHPEDNQLWKVLKR